MGPPLNKAKHSLYTRTSKHITHMLILNYKIWATQKYSRFKLDLGVQKMNEFRPCSFLLDIQVKLSTTVPANKIHIIKI